MSAPLRFLLVAVAGWGVVRAASMDLVPGMGVFTASPSEAAVPPIVPTSFPAIAPPELPDPYATQMAYAPPGYGYAPAPYGYPQPVPYYAGPAYAAVPQVSRPAAEPTARPDLYAAAQPEADWLLSRFAGASVPVRRNSAPVFAPAPKPRRLDRLPLTSWALLRGQSNPSGLATGGTLGGSQAGARLTYNFDRRFAASLRTSAPIGTARGGEVAAGIKVTPFPSVPVSLTAERRQAFGRGGGGRSAFALFLEGGVYQRPMPWRFQLDAYAQAGVVGVRHRDLFADGAFTLTRPLFGRYSAGFGMWGGVQPGLYRVDAGPRISMRVRDNIRVHLDYRQRLAGAASPPSGPALTLASDF